MRARMLAVAACAGLAWSAGAGAAAVPARAEIHYKVFLGSMKIGEGRDIFQHDGRTYSVVSESRTAGLAGVLYRLNIRRESRGRVTATGLRPDSFSETRNGKPERSAAFDWTRKEATLTDDGESQTVALPDDTWDTTSFSYNFAFVPPDSGDLDAHLTDGRRIRKYRYAILGRETLDTVLGPIETLHVKKVQGPDDKRAFEVWLAVGQHNMPVRIRYTGRDGRSFDSVVTQVSFGAK
jgi:hypothetical protein